MPGANVLVETAIDAIRHSPTHSPAANAEGVNNVINAEAQRQAKWRTANIELNRQRARDGMRKRRATLKDNG